MTLTECRFEKNAARGDGGAADFDDRTIASVSSALFSANQAGRNGGAIAITNRSSLESAGVTFQGNLAKHSGNDRYQDENPARVGSGRDLPPTP